MMPMKGFCNQTTQGGFTLIELMVVVVILGILAALIVPRIMDRPDQARQLQAKIQIESFTTALKLYKADNKIYPTTEQGLAALVTAPAGDTSLTNYQKNGYLDKKAVPKDPWGNAYIYLCPGMHDDFDIASYGADGAQGGENANKDITSWEVDE
jgi:general secretion pathway protein G